MSKISAIIITLNEAQHIARCIQSLQRVADEIIVVDSHSQDDTVSIAEGLGARVFLHEFAGYGVQKNIAAGYARYDWLLNIDADEALSPELEGSILEAKQQFTKDAYAFNRLTNYCGKWIRHCGWYPDTLIRLWHKDKAGVSANAVHEEFFVKPGATTGFLKGDLLHYSFPTLSAHLRKIEHYSETGARQDVARGKTCSLFRLWLVPKWKFFTTYIIRLGFLDGYYGYIISKNSAFATFMKYAKIRELQKLR
jgi:glycosyltransferase involved in cell wall biosynthesis